MSRSSLTPVFAGAGVLREFVEVLGISSMASREEPPNLERAPAVRLRWQADSSPSLSVMSRAAKKFPGERIENGERGVIFSRTARSMRAARTPGFHPL